LIDFSYYSLHGQVRIRLYRLLAGSPGFRLGCHGFI
jgi:hypothetical protein